MTVITRLDPPIPLDTPKGPGISHFFVWISVEEHIIWNVFMDKTGEIWNFPNPQVRAQKNIQMGRIVDNSYLIKDKLTQKDFEKNS